MTLYLLSTKTTTTVGRMIKYLKDSTTFERVGAHDGELTKTQVTEDFFLGLMASTRLKPESNEWVEFKELINKTMFKNVHDKNVDTLSVDELTHKEVYNTYIKDSPEVLANGILYDNTRKLVVIGYSEEVMDILRFDTREERRLARKLKRQRGEL